MPLGSQWLELPQRAHAVQRARAGGRVHRHGGADPRADRLHGALSVRVTRSPPRRNVYLGGAPAGDAEAYCDGLAERGIYLMTGTIFDRPEHFRISLTATMDTIERALPQLVAAATAP